MKVIVAYIDADEFEPIREELLELGIGSMSVSDASGSLPQATVTGHYRGVALENHLRAKVRLECVVGDHRVSTVVETVLKHEGKGAFAFVVEVAQAHPAGFIEADEEAAEAVT